MISYLAFTNFSFEKTYSFIIFETILKQKSHLKQFFLKNTLINLFFNKQKVYICGVINKKLFPKIKIFIQCQKKKKQS